ncbi:MAG: hypothetical protein Q8P22_08850 [Chloroflexota bacterium]|nr:hypothetical protein [Chloroflexota bacterium]
MGQWNERHKELMWRVVQAAWAQLGWWRLERGVDESCHFTGGFASGNTVDLYGDSLWECLERVEAFLREGSR